MIWGDHSVKYLPHMHEEDLSSVPRICVQMQVNMVTHACNPISDETENGGDPWDSLAIVSNEVIGGFQVGTQIHPLTTMAHTQHRYAHTYSCMF